MVRTSSGDRKSKRGTPLRERVKNPRTEFIAVRCTPAEYTAINDKATQSGLSIGAFLRSQALGDAGPRAVRRPPIERKELAQIKGWLGKLGGNLNQLMKAYHQQGILLGFPEVLAMRKEVAEMNAALMKALGRDHKG